MPGSLYSDLAKIYEKAVQLPNGGSITIIAVTTLSGGDITHAIPDNTGYITEGQLFLRNDSDTGKVIVDPFRSLSRLKQLVIGKKTREDHPQVMNAAVRLYADAANAKTKLENGFDLSDYDERALKFAYDYSEKLLAIDVNIEITQMLTRRGSSSPNTSRRKRWPSRANWWRNTGLKPSRAIQLKQNGYKIPI